MADHKVRRLPVIEGHGLIGIVSQADLARSIGEEKIGDLVEAISAAPLRASTTQALRERGGRRSARRRRRALGIDGPASGAPADDDAPVGDTDQPSRADA
jgi:CBS domain-containing protein